MVLTVKQTKAFFEEDMQMAIPQETVAQLKVEGIQNVSDLQDFNKNVLDQIASNLRGPAGGAAAFVFGAKSQKRLLVATKLVDTTSWLAGTSCKPICNEIM